MDFKIFFSKLSIIDIESIIEYYGKLNISTAEKYYKEIHSRIKNLLEFPEMGRIVPEFINEFNDKYRELIYENYRIIYKIQNDEIIIVRVIDGRRLLELNYID